MIDNRYMKNALIIIAILAFGTSILSLTLGNTQRRIDPNSLTGEYDVNDSLATFNGQKFTTHENEELAYARDKQVLGENTGEKRIEVDLSAQRVYAYEGDSLIYNFLISSGKWGRTPTGTFTIWGKFRYTKMEGGKKELNTYYYLPNVPYVMFFSNNEIPASRGFSFHGTYWHNNFGTPMSHGCINMKTEEAGLLYNWAEPNLNGKKSIRASDTNQGTKVIIYGTAPRS